jgi:hypothetical protein
MPFRITCPACRHVLTITEDVKDAWLTCPRCLAKVVNPGALVRGQRPPGSGPTPREESSLAASPTCPHCDKPVQPSWRRCPFCEAPLRPQRRSKPIRTADSDVRRDTGLIGGGLVLVGLLGGLGIIFFLCGGGLNQMKASEIRDVGVFTGILGVVLLSAVVGGIVLAAMGKNLGLRIGGTVVGAAAVVALVVALALSGFVYLLAGCMAPCEGTRDQKKQSAIGVPSFCRSCALRGGFHECS